MSALLSLRLAWDLAGWFYESCIDVCVKLPFSEVGDGSDAEEAQEEDGR